MMFIRLQRSAKYIYFSWAVLIISLRFNDCSLSTLNAVPQGPRWAFNYSVCVHSGLSVLTKIFFSSMICEHCDHSRPQGLGPEIHGSLQFRIDPILKTIVNQWFGGGLRNPYVETCIPTAICFIHQKWKVPIWKGVQNGGRPKGMT